MGPWGRLVESISSKYAFFPPKPASYDYTVDDDKKIAITSLYPSVRKLNQHVQFHFLHTTPLKGGGGGQQIFAAWIPYRQQKRRATILYSHANAIDIGQALPFFKSLSDDLGVNIFAYDYSGYGVSTGEPSVKNTLADAEAALECVCCMYSLQEEDIVAYGQSVGSGPTVYLGARHPRLAGIILHSPLMSGFRVLNPGVKCWPRCADVYPNLHLIQLVKASTLIMHGTEDTVIDLQHGKELFRLACNPYPRPLWAEGHSHHNVEVSSQYMSRLREFLAHVFPSEFTYDAGAEPSGFGAHLSSSDLEISSSKVNASTAEPSARSQHGSVAPAKMPASQGRMHSQSVAPT